MTFLHKLAHRLARLKAILLLGVVATSACEQPIAITSPLGSLASLLLSPKNLSLLTGQTTQFYVVGLTTSGDTAAVVVSWSVTGGSIVDTSSVGGRHYVHYRSPAQPGQYKVIAQIAPSTSPPVAGMATTSQPSISASAALTDSAVVVVSAVPVAAVVVSPPAASVLVGQTVQLSATPQDSTGAPLAGRAVSWATSNGGAATVNGSGLVMGVTAGSATITATSEGKSGTTAITVTVMAVASVAVSPPTANVPVGRTVQLTASLRDANGNPLTGRVVTWGSGNAGVATVNGSGLVSGVAVGAATITATSEGQSGTAAITVTVPPPPPPPGTWPNEPAGFTVINDYNVGSDFIPATDVPIALGLSGWSVFWNSAGNGTAISDAGAPFSPPAVYQVKYPNGWHDGSAPSTIDLPFPATGELYFGFWWKPSNPWQDHSAGNKLGFYYLTGVNDGMFMLMNSGSHTLQLTTEWGTSRNLPPNVAAVALTLGVWHRLEFHIKPSANLAEWWVDGTLSGRYTDVSFAAATLNEIKLSPTWGGYTGEVKAETDYFWYDHLHLSRP